MERIRRPRSSRQHSAQQAYDRSPDTGLLLIVSELHLIVSVAGPTGLDGPIPSPKVATRLGFATVEKVRTTLAATSITETELSNLFGTTRNLPSPVRAWSRVSSPAPTAIDGSCKGR